MKKAIIFDLDDTLVKCYVYYDQKIEAFCQKMNEVYGVDEDWARGIVKSIDGASFYMPGGFRRERFPNSFAAASVAIDVIHGKYPDNIRKQEMYDLANSVFAEPYEMIDGVYKVLKKYKKNGFKLALWTKGDTKIQERKIQMNKLDEIFGSNIKITANKTQEDLQETAEQFKIKSKHSWLIGDSLRGDIDNGIACGFNTIWVQGATQNWSIVQNNEVKPSHIVKTVTEVPTIISYKGDK